VIFRHQTILYKGREKKEKKRNISKLEIGILAGQGNYSSKSPNSTVSLPTLPLQWPIVLFGILKKIDASSRIGRHISTPVLEASFGTR